ncbi:MAG: hypothetical protein AAF231_08650 [Pseudomonadota bacterium]
MQYEYKVVPAPAKPRKTPKIKGAEAKFAYGIEATMNEYAADGWEYQRADILPSEERRGFRSTQTVYRTVLVFRRAIAVHAVDHGHTEAAAYAAAPQPQPEVAPEMQPEPRAEYHPEPQPEYHPEPAPEHPQEHPQEPTYEEAREAERRARFSLVGPARRGEDSSAPPLSAPHVHGDDMGGSGNRD